MRETRIDVAGEVEGHGIKGGIGAKMSKTTEIKPGLDLNLAVLKVLGASWRDDWKDETGWKMAAWYFDKDGSVACRDEIPQFSTDLNAAFAAAEKFSDYFVLNKCEYTKGEWDCKLVFTDCPTAWVRESTPALAICAAILKVKG